MKKVMIPVCVVIALTAGLVWSCAPSAEEKQKAAAAREIVEVQEKADREAIAPSAASYNQNGNAEEAEFKKDEVVADKLSAAAVSSSAAVENPKDTKHKFIRTAQLKFRVKNVEKSTYAIEDIVARHDGFVTYTNLSSDIDHVSKESISADSMLETTRFTVVNDITIRVPNTKLDTTLKEIALLIDHLDYRVIKADDVALNLLENDMTQSRITRNTTRLQQAIENRGRKLGETTEAEELLLSRQEQADNARIANMKLHEQINYSTLNINIYQRQSIKREVIADDSNVDSYGPGFGSRILDSLQSGWKVFEAIFVFVVKLWGVMLIIVLVYLVYRRFRAKS